jgi:hypothetical protein
MRVLFYPANLFFFESTPYNVDKFVLPLPVDFFVDVTGKKSMSCQQSHFFADVTVTFSLPHQQKSQHMG